MGRVHAQTSLNCNSSADINTYTQRQGYQLKFLKIGGGGKAGEVVFGEGIQQGCDTVEPTFQDSIFLQENLSL